MPASTLRTPLSPALTLSRTIAPHAVSIEIQDDTGKALYTEEIALSPATTKTGEPSDAEQGDIVL